MGRKGQAIYLVFCDLADPKYEQEFNAWYDTEHLPQLLSLPGILDAARYVAVKGGPKYLAVYELEDLGAIQGPAFQERPRSAWERRIAPAAVGTNVARVLGRQFYPDRLEDAQRGMAPALQIGRMSVAEAIEAEWNAWYNGDAIPSFRQVPGVRYARRFQVLDGEVRYTTIYEFEHDKVGESAEWIARRDAASPRNAQMRQAMQMAPGSPGVYRKI